MSGQLALIASLIAVVLLGGAGCWLTVRRQLISRRDGIISCALRQSPDAAWRRGLAEYQPAQLCWHRSVSLRLRPAVCFDRAGLTILATRAPAGQEAARLGAGLIIAECEVRRASAGGSTGGERVDLALSQAALTGLLSWLESSPRFYRRAS